MRSRGQGVGGEGWRRSREEPVMVRTGQSGPSVKQDLDDLIVIGVGRQHQGLHVGSEAGLNKIM